MKAYYLLAPLGAALLAGCAFETTYTTPTPVAVAPAYVAPANTVVLGTTSPSLIDSDGDGYSNAVDRFPFDSRFH